MKRKKIVSSFLVLTLSLAMLLQSCGGGGKEDETGCMLDTELFDAEQTDTEDISVYEEKVYISIDGISEYVVVYEAGSENARTAAKAFYSRMLTRYKTSMVIKSSDEVEYDKNAKEIYIGETGFAESIEAEKLLENAISFCVAKIGEKIVVIAGTDGLYVEKMNEYIEKVIDANASFDPMTGKASVLFSEYADHPQVSHTKIMLNGNDLKEYTIIYSAESTGYLKRKVEYLREEIKQSYGVLLPMGLDTETDESKLEILVGYTNREESKSFKEKHDPTAVEYCA